MDLNANRDQELDQLRSQLFYLQQSSQQDAESLALLMKNLGYKVSKLHESVEEKIKQSEHKLEDKSGHRRHLPSIASQQKLISSQGIEKFKIEEEQQLNKNKSARDLQLSKDFSGEVFYKQQRFKRKRYSESVTELIKSAKQEVVELSKQPSKKTLLEHKQPSEGNDISNQSQILDLRIARNNVVKQISKKLNIKMPSSLQSSSTAAPMSINMSNNGSSIRSIVNQNSIIQPSSIINQSIQQNNMSIISMIDNSQINNSSLFANEDSIIQNIQGLQENNKKQLSPTSQEMKKKQHHFKLKLHEPRILPKELRENPFAVMPVVKEKDLQIGLFELINKGLIPRDTDIEPAFQRGSSTMQAKKINIHSYEEKLALKNQLRTYNDINLTKFKLEASNANINSSLHQKYKLGQNIQDSSIISKQNDFFLTAGMQENEISKSAQLQNEDNNESISGNQIQNFIENSLKKSLNISFLDKEEQQPQSSTTNKEQQYSAFFKGKRTIKIQIIDGKLISNDDYKKVRRTYSENWGNIFHHLNILQRICKKYKINQMFVDGNKLAFHVQDLFKIKREDLLNCVINKETVAKIMPTPEKGAFSVMVKAWAVSRFKEFLLMIRAKKALKEKKELVNKDFQ